MTLSAESTLPAARNDPSDSTEPTDPIEPIDSTDPTDPIDSTDPSDARDSTEPRDFHDSTERDDVMPLFYPAGAARADVRSPGRTARPGGRIVMTGATDEFLALGEQSFVSLTTYRRSGEPVPTPVWLARSGGDLVVTTTPDSGKVKRLRRDARVTLRPCDRRGTVADGAPTVAGTAVVLSDPAEVQRHRQALRDKYGLQYRAFAVVQAVFGVVRRVRGRRPPAAVILRISPA